MIKLLKSGKYALDGFKIVLFKEGQVVELKQSHEEQLVKAKWAMLCDADGKAPQAEKAKPLSTPPAPPAAPQNKESREVLEERYLNSGGRPNPKWTDEELQKRLADRMEKTPKA